MSAEMPLIDIRPDHWKIVQRILQEYVPDLRYGPLGLVPNGAPRSFRTWIWPSSLMSHCRLTSVRH